MPASMKQASEPDNTTILGAIDQYIDKVSTDRYAHMGAIAVVVGAALSYNVLNRLEVGLPSPDQSISCYVEVNDAQFY